MKSNTVLQAADLVAWCHNLYLTKNGKIPNRYDQALSRLSAHTHDWGAVNLSDPDRIPTLLKIPLRDPTYRYDYRTVKHRGKRRPVVRYWPKDLRELPISKKELVLPEVPILTPEDVVEAQKRYDAARPEKCGLMKP